MRVEAIFFTIEATVERISVDRKEQCEKHVQVKEDIILSTLKRGNLERVATWKVMLKHHIKSQQD